MFINDDDNSFRTYLKAGTENLERTLAGQSPFLTMMDNLDLFIRNHIIKLGVIPDDFIVHSLRVNARFMLMIAFRIGLTGHAAGVYPTLRTALETACYALIMSKDKLLVDKWVGRNDSPEGMKACKSAFQSPIKKAQKIMNVQRSNYGDVMYQLYDWTIDFGAHPNPKTVTLHARLSDDEDSGVTRYENIALYGDGSFEFERTLFACIEMGLVTIIALLMSYENTSPESIQGINALNEEKDRLEALIRKNHEVQSAR